MKVVLCKRPLQVHYYYDLLLKYFSIAYQTTENDSRFPFYGRYQEKE